MAAAAPLRAVATFLEMIKVGHTVFALPFALGAAFLGAGGPPPLTALGKVLLAVLFARTAAMSFNRLADRSLDALNPRTALRALPAGKLSPRFVALSTLVALGGFFAVCASINRLALLLSPLAVAIFLGYSYSKRVTVLCHLLLGTALALAPLGAWIAVTGRLAWEPLGLAFAVLLWTSGFDILYSCLDASFDRRHRLRSIPARWGITAALAVARGLHLGMVIVLGALAWGSPALGGVFVAALAVVACLLAYEHTIVRPGDLRQMNRAFFTTNGLISFLLMTALIIEAVRP